MKTSTVSTAAQGPRPGPSFSLGRRRAWLAAIGAATWAVAGRPAWAQTLAASPTELEQALERMLRNRPELVRDALQELQRREEADKAQREQRALLELAPAIYSNTGATVLGNPLGDVTLVVFSDYQCGYCKRLAASVDELLSRDPKLRVLIKHLPILGPESTEAAQLMLSVKAGPQAYRVHQALINSSTLDATSLQAVAQNFKLGAGTRDAARDAAQRGLDEVRGLAGQLGIEGTPALVIGSTLVRGAVDTAQLAAAIQAARPHRL